MASLRFLAPAALALLVSSMTMGCATETEDSEASEAELAVQGAHEPQGDERKAILNGFHKQLDKDLKNQDFLFNSTSPKGGRFVRHGDWAYLQGIIEGPNGNKTPVNYKNSAFKDEADYFDGIQRNGHFAASFQGLAHKKADGTWEIATSKSTKDKAYSVGSDYWTDWAGTPAIGFRDVFVKFPVDDLHAPKGAERDAIVDAMHAALKTPMHSQTFLFNSTDPVGTFNVHDGWAYFSGIIEGPNGNQTAVDYNNTAYKSKIGNGFQGLLRNGNFAATVKVILKKQANGTWVVSPTKSADFSSPGYAVGADEWVGDPASDFAYDILPGGDGDGEGDGGEGGEGGD